jgi:hypothetical protein
MKLKYTGTSEGSITLMGKYSAEPGTVLEDVPAGDADVLLQTGSFQLVEETKPSKKAGSAPSDFDNNSGSGTGGSSK